MAESPLQGAEEADLAVARSLEAGPAWRSVAPADRARLLRRFAAQVEDHGEELAQLETRNVGKPISESRDDVAMVADVMHFYAGAVDKHRGSTVPVAGGVDMTFHEPLGVVAAIIPWNFPAAIASWKIGPALATGNTIVVKPAEITPMTALRLAELALDAGIPEGVLQVVVGKGSVIGSRLVEHPGVAKVAFTGSTEVGREVMARAAGTIKRVTLELGGKSASIIFADADLEKAAAATPGGVFANAGQDCCARSRVLVQAAVFDRYLALLDEAVASWTVGDPTEPATRMGPLVSAAHRRARAGLPGAGHGRVRRRSGPRPYRGHGSRRARVLVPAHGGGTGPGQSGRWPERRSSGRWWWSSPSRTKRMPSGLANDTPYGLSGSIWTRDGSRALRMARSVQAGNLSVNSNSSVRVQTSFGGMKQSGFGRELGLEALDSYTDVKNVFVSTEG